MGARPSLDLTVFGKANWGGVGTHGEKADMGFVPSLALPERQGAYSRMRVKLSVER